MDHLSNFVDALSNYDLFGETKLVKYGLRVFVYTKQLDFEKAKKYCKKFDKEISDLELYGTSDLTDPVWAVINPKVKSKGKIKKCEVERSPPKIIKKT